jgi:hypothetical protein
MNFSLMHHPHPVISCFSFCEALVMLSVNKKLGGVEAHARLEKRLQD